MNLSKLIAINPKTSNFLLLAAIFILIFLVPQTAEAGHHELFIRINFSLLLICSLLVVNDIDNKAAIIVALMIAAQWITDLIDWQVTSEALKIIIILAFIYTVFHLIVQIASGKTISSLVILEAINAYLLLGIVFSLLVQFIVAIDPSAYHVAPEADNNIGEKFNHSDTIYYAFTALTTVGYGDITPLSPIARSLSIVISVSGQMYLTVILALIVGKFANLKHDEK